jgi:hypothetical protein
MNEANHRIGPPQGRRFTSESGRVAGRKKRGSSDKALLVELLRIKAILFNALTCETPKPSLSELASLVRAYDGCINRIRLLRGRGWPAPVKSEPPSKLDLARRLSLPDIPVEAEPPFDPPPGVEISQ